MMKTWQCHDAGEGNLSRPCFFVEDSPVYLNENLNPLKGLANGTFGLQKRLIFDTPHKQAEYDRVMSEKKWVPGELLMLDNGPTAVMHAFPSLPHNTFDKAGCFGDLCTDDNEQEVADESGTDALATAAMAAVEQQVHGAKKKSCLVIPVPIAKRPKKVTIGCGKAKMEWRYMHTGYEHAFAVTYYKGIACSTLHGSEM